MRKLSLTVVAAMLLSAGTLMANNNPVVDTSKSLSVQISEMLSDHNFKNSNQDLTAQVRFTLNTEGEIVILSVDTDFETLEYFVKSKLNYQHVDLDQIVEGKIYTVPVTIKA